MKGRKKILAISGSTRKSSANSQLIKIIEKFSVENFEIEIYSDLDTLPHFNPDLDIENAPSVISEFRKKLKTADAILICSPEYALGVPGTLKNAIDWTVSSMEFSKKPVALITAASSGTLAHRSLLDTLLIIESHITEATQLHIPQIKQKISNEEIIDSNLKVKIEALIKSLVEMTNNSDRNNLSSPLLQSGGVTPVS